MLRKHINSLPVNQHDQIPFYSWNCITLQLKHRDVDLVIRDERDMRHLLMFLIYTLKTRDGDRDSAVPLINAVTKQDCVDAKRLYSVGYSEKKQRHTAKLSQHKVLKQTCFKYLILTIRNKISFSAFQKGMTIPELFLRTIQNTYL